MGSAKCKAQLYSTPTPVTDRAKDQPQVTSAPGMRVHIRKVRARIPPWKLLLTAMPWSHGFDRAHTSSSTSSSIPLFPPGHLLCLTSDMSSVVRRPWSPKEPKMCSKATITDLYCYSFPSDLWHIKMCITDWLIKISKQQIFLFTSPQELRAFVSFIKMFYDFRENGTPDLLQSIFFVVKSLIVAIEYPCA